MRQPDFRRLILAQILVYMSFLVIDTTGFYLNVFYVHGGDMGAGAAMKGWYGTAFQVSGLIAVPLIVRLAGRIGKRRAFLACTLTIALGGIAKWFCYVPGAGWWLLLPSLLMGPGLVAVMVLAPSMTADICDVDAADHGARREGLFNAVLAWSIKAALTSSMPTGQRGAPPCRLVDRTPGRAGPEHVSSDAGHLRRRHGAFGRHRCPHHPSLHLVRRVSGVGPIAPHGRGVTPHERHGNALTLLVPPNAQPSFSYDCGRRRRSRGVSIRDFPVRPSPDLF
jgi:hypothetical protein